MTGLVAYFVGFCFSRMFSLIKNESKGIVVVLAGSNKAEGNSET